MICPKNHNYSDISHLLTHIASKSHLSNYFHAQVRKDQDAELAKKLRAFDDWYARNDMEKLLSQRMAQKEAKKAGRTRASPTIAAPTRPKAQKRGQTSQKNINSERSQADQRKYAIDPALTNVKVEVDNQSFGPSTPDVCGELGHHRSLTAMSQPLTPPGFETNSINASFQFIEPYHIHSRVSTYPNYGNLYMHAAEREDPFSNPRFPSSSLCGSPLARRPGSYVEGRASGQRWTNPMNDMDQTSNEVQSDASRLKGIIWPGMDLFDAASPEARRMRNQKKGTSVLASMQATSELIEPTEVILYPSWEIKKERFISGEVESSPPPESPVDNRRPHPRNARAPMSELDINAPVSRRKAVSKRRTRSTAGDKTRRLSTSQETNLQEGCMEQMVGLKRNHDSIEDNINIDDGGGNASYIHGRRLRIYRDTMLDGAPKSSLLGSPTSHNENNVPEDQVWYSQQLGNSHLRGHSLSDGSTRGGLESARHQSFFQEKENIAPATRNRASHYKNIPNGLWHSERYAASFDHRYPNYQSQVPSIARVPHSRVASYHEFHPNQTLNPLSLSVDNGLRGLPWWSELNIPSQTPGLERPKSFSKSPLHMRNALRTRKPSIQPEESSGDETIDEGIDDALDGVQS